MKSTFQESTPANGRAPFVASRVAIDVPGTCREAVERIPRLLRGDARIRHLADEVRRLPDRDRIDLSSHLDQLLHYMLEHGASDMDFGGPAAKGYVWFRIDGEKRPHEKVGTYSVDEASFLLLCQLNQRQIDVLFDEYAVDFSRTVDLGTGREGRHRFRCSLYYDYDQLAISVRAITNEVRPIKSIGFHPVIERGLMFRYERDGLTLVTGVTGSGKSTTLDAIIDANNRDVAAHVVIIGHPIEYMHESKRCIVRHREVGKDVRSFKDGIVQALRQDPDMVVIGEMRDPTTISAALEITDSGHKVFSTLHTSSAVESIDRIIAEYPPHEQERVRNRLADVLRCVISQKLCPKIGGGRILAKEVLWMLPSARAAIKNNNTAEIYQMMWEGGSHGEVTMEQDLVRLARQRLITPETAMNYANNKRRIQQLLS
ncbi:MAG: type IV pilus twitching motility protein PilT [Rhodothermales bacterium]